MKIWIFLSAWLSLAKTQCLYGLSDCFCELSNMELQGSYLNQGNLIRTEYSGDCEQICDLTIDCEGFTYYENESK